MIENKINQKCPNTTPLRKCFIKINFAVSLICLINNRLLFSFHWWFFKIIVMTSVWKQAEVIWWALCINNHEFFIRDFWISIIDKASQIKLSVYSSSSRKGGAYVWMPIVKIFALKNIYSCLLPPLFLWRNSQGLLQKQNHRGSNHQLNQLKRCFSRTNKR